MLWQHLYFGEWMVGYAFPTENLSAVVEVFDKLSGFNGSKLQQANFSYSPVPATLYRYAASVPSLVSA